MGDLIVVYLLIRGVVVGDDSLNEAVEAIVDAFKSLHSCTRQELKDGDEVCRVAAAHHVIELVSHCHQAEQVLVIVAVTLAKANPTDDISHRDDYVAEGVEAALSLHERVDLFEQTLYFFADVFLQNTGVLRVLALQGGDGAQGAVGQLSSSAPHTGLVCTESQALAIIDVLEAVQVRPPAEIVPLPDEGLSNRFASAEHDHRTHADLDLEDVTVALAHRSKTLVRFAAELKQIPNDRQGHRSRQATETFRNVSVETLEKQVDQTHRRHGQQTFGYRH